MPKRGGLRIDIGGQIPDLPLQPAMVRAPALPHVPTPVGRSGSIKNVILLPRREIAHREPFLTQNPIPSNESHRMNLAVSREAGVMRVPPRWALNNFISLFPLLLLVGCCQFFRGADDVVSFTISPLNMSIQPGTTQKFSATGTFGLSDTGDITSRVKWASSNPARVTIDSAGLATAIAYGTVTISGAYECYTADTSLSVVNQTAPIGSIAVTPQTPKIMGDLTQHLSREQPTRMAPTVPSQALLNGRLVITQLQPTAPQVCQLE